MVPVSSTMIVRGTVRRLMIFLRCGSRCGGLPLNRRCTPVETTHGHAIRRKCRCLERMATSHCTCGMPENVRRRAHAPRNWPRDPAAPYGSAYWGTPAAHRRATEVVGVAESDP